MTRGLARKGFDIDLAYGEIHEDVARNILTGTSPTEHVLFESKADDKSSRTGNVFVEFECNGVPSGLSTTQSDFYWFHLTGTGRSLLIATDKLKEICKEVRGKRNCIVKGGDFDRARGFLLTVEELLFDKKDVDWA